MRTVGLRRFAEKLAWEHQAREYVAVWRRLLARRLGTSPDAAPPRQRTATTEAEESMKSRVD
jgi:hypothetical protein